MKTIIKSIKKTFARTPSRKTDKPEARKRIIEQAVRRSIQEYGEALRRLGAE